MALFAHPADIASRQQYSPPTHDDTKWQITSPSATSSRDDTWAKPYWSTD